MKLVSTLGLSKADVTAFFHKIGEVRTWSIHTEHSAAMNWKDSL